jgi:hypothetical protein
VAISDLTSADTELAARGYGRFSQARRFAWLNAAKNRFEDYPYDWPWLKTSASGTAPLTISDLRRVLSVVDSATKLPVDQVDADAIIEFASGDLTLAGSPSGWYLDSDTVLSTFPVGAGSLTVRYVKFSPELATGTDAPLIPARYRMTWVDLAEVEALRYGVKDGAAAAVIEQGAFRRLSEIAGVYAMQAQPAYSEMLMTGASVDG